MSGLWLLVVLAPALWLAVYRCRPATAVKGLWLAALPALVAALWPPDPLGLSWLWPGARWGLVEPVRQTLLALTAAIWGGAGIFAADNGVRASAPGRFWLFWSLALTGNLLLVVSLDGPGFYVGYSLMSLSAWGLILYLGGEQARRGGRVYLQLAILSEMLIYAGLMMRIHQAGGAMELAQWRQVPADSWTAVLLLAGFGIKLGVWPLHGWLPRTYPVAPPVVCALLSGAMMKAGVLGLWLFMPTAGGWRAGAEWLLLIAVITAFYGVLLGLTRTAVRTVLACSTISQAGYLLAILALAWQQPEQRAQWGMLVALFAVHHGLAKAALFLGAGLSAAAPLKPWHWVVMGVPALSLAGVPLTTGAAVKTRLEKAVATTGFDGWLILLTLGSLATALLMWWALGCLYRDRARSGGEPPRALLYPWGLLCVASLALPWLWPEMQKSLLASLAGPKLWNMSWPTALAALVIMLTARAGLRASRLSGYVSRWCGAAGAGWTIPRLPRLPLSIRPRGKGYWRRVERRWNRLASRRAVVASTWILCLLLLLGWLLR